MEVLTVKWYNVKKVVFDMFITVIPLQLLLCGISCTYKPGTCMIWAHISALPQACVCDELSPNPLYTLAFAGARSVKCNGDLLAVRMSLYAKWTFFTFTQTKMCYYCKIETVWMTMQIHSVSRWRIVSSLQRTPTPNSIIIFFFQYFQHLERWACCAWYSIFCSLLLFAFVFSMSLLWHVLTSFLQTL